MNIEKLREQLLLEIVNEMSGNSLYDLKVNSEEGSPETSQESIDTKVPSRINSHCGLSDAPLYILRITLDKLYNEYHQIVKDEVLKELRGEIRELIREERSKPIGLMSYDKSYIPPYSLQSISCESDGLTLSQIIRSYTTDENKSLDSSLSIETSLSTDTTVLIESTDSMKTYPTVDLQQSELSISRSSISRSSTSRSGSNISRVQSDSVNSDGRNSPSHAQLVRVKSLDIITEDIFPGRGVKIPVARRAMSNLQPTPPIPRRSNSEKNLFVK